MTAFEKDKMKKKDEASVEDMKEQIEEALAEEKAERRAFDQDAAEAPFEDAKGDAAETQEAGHQAGRDGLADAGVDARDEQDAHGAGVRAERSARMSRSVSSSERRGAQPVSSRRREASRLWQASAGR